MFAGDSVHPIWSSSSVTIHACPLVSSSLLGSSAVLILGRRQIPAVPAFGPFNLFLQGMDKGKGVTGHLSFFNLKSVGSCQILIQIM